MRITILTLFPDMFTGVFSHSMLKRAQDKTLHQRPPLEIEVINIRDFATDKHKITDDRPYGGGAGMVMKIEPIHRALLSLPSLEGRTSNPTIGGSEQKGGLIREGERSKSQPISSQATSSLPRRPTEADSEGGSGDLSRSRRENPSPEGYGSEGKTSTIHNPQSTIVLTSAKGAAFTQAKAQKYSTLDHLVIICGHYEGVDQRVADHLVDEEVRIGDYVLTGGEPAAMVITDAVTRLLPGVLGNNESATHESHSEPGYLEYPQYTRPEVYNGWEVPKVLLQGNHKQIEEWRKSDKTAT